MTTAKVTAVSNSNNKSFIDEAIEKTTNIGTLPSVAIELMKLVNDPDSSVEDVLQVIESDPALGSRLLKVVNSSFYGMPQSVTTIERAVVLLGLNAVKNIATAASLHKVFKPGELGTDFDPSELWVHSVAVATAARDISARTGKGFPEEAFLAGLIHDIGILVEMQACRKKFIELLELLTSQPDLMFREAEFQTIGYTHENFGAAICRAWKFPVNLAIAAGNHHEPMKLKEEFRTLPAVVCVADSLAARLEIGYQRTVDNTELDDELLSWLNIDIFDIESVEQNLLATIEESQELLCSN